MIIAVGLVKRVMNSIRPRHIVIAFVVAFILFILLRANENHYPVANPGAQVSYSSYDSGHSYSSSSKGTQLNSNLNRHEILQKKVKGYRESTYWGLEHPTQEKTKDLSDDEFDRFISEELELNDVDVYWGAEY